MVKLIPFPKEEYRRYLEALNYYQQEDYLSARFAFQSIQHVPGFRSLITKPFIMTLIALKDFRTAYRWIEDALAMDPGNEDELIESYIYTMIQEKKYSEAIELIYLFLEAWDLSDELKKALYKLKHLAKACRRKDEIEQRLNQIKFTYHDGLVELIRHFDDFDIQTHESLILDIFQDPYADPFIKYQLLERLNKSDYDKTISYVNGLREQFYLTREDFTPLEALDCVQIPPKLANHLLERDAYVVDLKFIENIWINEYIMVYPKKLTDYELIAFHLRDKVLYLMGEQGPLGQIRID
ncbi:MAG TPA: hypothetical protein VIK63_02115 [Haloplasmataceae bacterium]